jgi:hypothetical protein
MPRFIARPALAILQAGFFTVLTACQSSAVDDGQRKPALFPTADATAYQQLIVKFKAATLRCNPTDIAHLAAQIDVRLEMVRPLSGDACVIKQLRTVSGDFSRGQKLLQQHPSIEWVELDAVMKTM